MECGCPVCVEVLSSPTAFRRSFERPKRRSRYVLMNELGGRLLVGRLPSQDGSSRGPRGRGV